MGGSGRDTVMLFRDAGSESKKGMAMLDCDNVHVVYLQQ